MHKINEYIFDSDRVVLYKADLDDKIVAELKSTFKSSEERYNLIYSSLMKMDSEHMCMNKVEIDNFGIMLTYNCNLRCRYCAYSSGGESECKLKSSDVEAFVDDAIKRRTIKKLVSKKNDPMKIEFTGGGEPTYEWDLLIKTVNYIKQECDSKNIPYKLSMTTNGILSDAQIDFIGNNFAELMISYDGLPNIHDQNRPSPNLKKTSPIVMHSIRELARRNIKLTVRTTVWQSDFHKIKKMYCFLSENIPEDGKIIWSIYPTEYDGRAIESMKRLDTSEINTLLSYFADLVRENEKNNGSNIVKVTLPIFIETPCDIFCGAPSIASPWLLPDSNITTCVESPNGRVIIGKVKDGKVDYFDDYSDVFLRVTQEKHMDCRKCIAYNFCMGGCPMWHLRERINADEPQECSLQKAFLNYVIDSALRGEHSFDWHLEKIELPSGHKEGIYKLVNGGKKK